MNKNRLVSGITATGKLTIGNYIGAIKNFVALQDKYEMYIFVADLHALTNNIDPDILKANREQVMALYIACGLDPEKVTLFYQSEVAEHAQMGWIMENRTTIGELSRMTQYKDKSQKQQSKNGTDKITTGLLTYPALMAGDILLYNPSVVPTGKDQKQHLELTRNIAERFNNQFGETFNIPEPYIAKEGSKIMSLTEPTSKMSKSSLHPKSYIALLDDPEVAYKKIMKALTDSEGKVYASEKKPAITNLLTIYSQLKGISIEAAELEFKDVENYGPFKKAVAETVRDFLSSIQAKYKNALKSIYDVSQAGAEKASALAKETLDDVKRKIGLK